MASNKIKIQIPSAVLVLHDLSSDTLILTKRSLNLRHHPGEICFPGGLWEAADKDLYHTALREVYEELLITPSRIKPIKGLQVEKTGLGSIIHPWLACIESINPFVMNSFEVTSVISIPMGLVKNQENYHPIKINRDGYQFTSLQFIAHDEFIWGATARIMNQLCS